MSDDGVILSADEILRTLSRAVDLARLDEGKLATEYPDWSRNIEELQEPRCPKTYLPVLCVLLVARSLRPRVKLDVLAIQKQEGPFGYSASSIGSQLIPFATEHGIDLRARSSQVMNNQPFTYKRRIDPSLSPKPEFQRFFEFATQANDLNEIQAADVLALVFTKSKLVMVEVADVQMDGGLEAVTTMIESVAKFVDGRSENGKIGQAFVAAALDAVYGAESVALGKVSDPDASVPGDVHVDLESETWLYVEVKQKPVTTGDVGNFLEKVDRVGGERILYAALANARYPRNIDEAALARSRESNRIDWFIVQSPGELAQHLFRNAPGSLAQVASRFATAFLRRMIEAGVSTDSLDDYGAIIL